MVSDEVSEKDVVGLVGDEPGVSAGAAGRGSVVLEAAVCVAGDVDVAHKSVKKFRHGDTALSPFSANERHVETSANSLLSRDCLGWWRASGGGMLDVGGPCEQG